MLARVPSEAVVVSAYSSASLCTEILKGLFMLHTVCTVLYCTDCTVLYLHTVWPAVPVTAVVGAAPRHRSSVPQYLHHTGASREEVRCKRSRIQTYTETQICPSIYDCEDRHWALALALALALGSTHRSLVSMVVVTLPLTGESHCPSAMKM